MPPGGVRRRWPPARYDENEMSAFARGAYAALLVAISTVPVLGQPADGCSHDAFVIDGATVGVTLCPGAAAPARRARSDGQGGGITVLETFSSASATFSRTTVVVPDDQSGPARAIDDVSLDRLGITKTLHLTIAYRGGATRLEHALLIPGAVPLK
jgi:hypothetical protein